MDIKKIIYCNEYSGKVEVYNSFNLLNAGFVKINGNLYKTEALAKNLYLDREVRFSLFSSTIDMQDFLLGKPKLDTNKKEYELKFSLVDVSPTSLTINVTEQFNGKDMASVGKIEFYKKKGVEIKGERGDAVIRIFDVPYLSGAHESQYAMGQFACNVGLFYFVDLGGEWGNLDNSASFVDATRNALAKDIKECTIKQTSIIKKDTEIVAQKVDDIQEKIDSSKNEILLHIDMINEKIESLENSFKIYKEDLESKIEDVFEDFDRERLISSFSDQVVDRIRRSLKLFNENESYKSVVNSLKIQFEEQWEKMGVVSKDFLITAKILFNNMNNIDKPLDYSGVCILVSKAVEVELKERFYKKFTLFLDERYKEEYDKWPYALCRKKKKNGKTIATPIEEIEFTLGTVPHVCCLYKPIYMSDDAYDNSKEAVISFAKEKLFLDDADDEIRGNLKYIGKVAAHIKDKYRNPAAHTGTLSKKNAQECLNEVVDIQKELKKVLSCFRE